MSQALYVGMFSQIQLTSNEKKRARRKWITEKACKALGYAGVILGAASMAQEPLASIGMASLLCLVAECFR